MPIKPILTILFLCLGFAGFCQSDSYYPLQPGRMKNYRYFRSYKTVYYQGPVTLEGRTYFRESRKYRGAGVSDTLLRVSNDTVYTYCELRNKDVPYFGIRPLIGQKIGYGTIISTGAIIETPFAVYTGLLEVKINIPPNKLWKYGTGFTYFLKKGVGIVAVMRGSQITEYLIE